MWFEEDFDERGSPRTLCALASILKDDEEDKGMGESVWKSMEKL